MKREVSEKVVLVLLIVLVLISAFGVYMMYDTSNDKIRSFDSATGSVVSSNDGMVGMIVLSQQERGDEG